MSVEAKLGAWLRADSENEAMRICITLWKSSTYKHILNYVKLRLFLSLRMRSKRNLFNANRVCEWEIELK